MSNKLILCGCGYGEPTHFHNSNNGLHLLGEGDCARKLATRELVPTNFRVENGVQVCDVNGYTITTHTLFEQRLYSEEVDGQWTLPKDESSVNSIEMD